MGITCLKMFLSIYIILILDDVDWADLCTLHVVVAYSIHKMCMRAAFGIIPHTCDLYQMQEKAIIPTFPFKTHQHVRNIL